MGTPITEVDSRVAIFFMLMFFSPIVLYHLAKFIALLRPDPTTIEIVIEPEKPKRPVTYQDIVQAAMEKAAEGDNASRQWVMENVFKKQETKTPTLIINETVAALKAVGYKHKDAVELVNRVAANKQFSDPSTLFRECMKK